MLQNMKLIVAGQGLDADGEFISRILAGVVEDDYLRHISETANRSLLRVPGGRAIKSVICQLGRGMEAEFRPIKVS